MKLHPKISAATALLLAGCVHETIATDVAAGEERLVPIRTHALYAPYVDQDLQNRWWDFGADAIVNTNKHIRLTQDRPSQMGWLWSRLPIKAENFEVEVEFSIDGKGHSLFGDGMAVWLTQTRAQPGPVFGSVDYFSGLALFLDTYANSRHSYSFPRLTAMLGDGKSSYDHDHDNQANELAACSMDFRRRDHPTKLRVRYLKNKSLKVQLMTEKDGYWNECFEVFDFALPEGEVFLGFSALTGDVSDAHDVISVTTNSILPNRTSLITPQNQSTSNRRKKSSSSSSGGLGVFLFLLKAIGVLAFCAFAFSAYRTYNAQKKGKRF